ncbi:hypothetical protein ACFSNO_07265 [Streptomyces cirratus]
MPDRGWSRSPRSTHGGSVAARTAVRQVVTHLARQQRLTLLLGPSGSGKSSLIRAGVLRALADGEVPAVDRWLTVLARPATGSGGGDRTCGTAGGGHGGDQCGGLPTARCRTGPAAPPAGHRPVRGAVHPYAGRPRAG